MQKKFVACALIIILAAVVGCGKEKKLRELREHALMVHAYKGELDAIKDLLAKGTDVNARDERGGTALMQAAVANKTDVVKFLLESGADIDAQTDGGNTALIAAAGKGNREILQILLDAGANPLLKNQGGQTAAVKAAFSKQSDCVVLLKTAEVAKEAEQGQAAEEQPADQPE
jgi:ankyrin repeat protein